MSSIVNKVKEVLHSDKSDKHSHNDPSHAQHHSNVAGTHQGATSGLHTTGPQDGSYTDNTNYTTGTGPATHTAGPHSSNIANKADPRVDSDRDNRGAAFNSHSVGTTGTHSTSTSTNLGGSTGVHGGAGQTTGSAFGASNQSANPQSFATGPATNTAGPHSSNIANKVDPRVDSDLDNRAPVGSHQTHATGTHGAYNTRSQGTTGNTATAPSGTYGHHDSRIANAADPRIDSDGSRLPGSTQHHQTTTGHSAGGLHQSGATNLGTAPGPAPNTAGPHSSDLLNKVDPRVDSDLDGSKTLGQNQTFQNQNQNQTFRQ